MNAGEVRVTGKGSKTRIVPLAGFAIAALQAWLAVRDQLAKLDETALFVGARGSRITPRVVQLRMKQWGIKQGITSNVRSASACATRSPPYCAANFRRLRAVQEIAPATPSISTRRSIPISISIPQQDLRRGHPRRQKENQRNNMTSQKPKSHSTHTAPRRGTGFRNRIKRSGKVHQTIRAILRAARHSRSPAMPPPTPQSFSRMPRKSLLRRHPVDILRRDRTRGWRTRHGDTLPGARCLPVIFSPGRLQPGLGKSPRGYGRGARGNHRSGIFSANGSPMRWRARRELKLADHSCGMRLIHAGIRRPAGTDRDQYGDVLYANRSAGAERWRDAAPRSCRNFAIPRAFMNVPIPTRAAGRSGVTQRLLHGQIAGSRGNDRARPALQRRCGGRSKDRFLSRTSATPRADRNTGTRPKNVLNCSATPAASRCTRCAGGAKSVLSIDASGDALRIAEENLTSNGLDATRAEWAGSGCVPGPAHTGAIRPKI